MTKNEVITKSQGFIYDYKFEIPVFKNLKNTVSCFWKNQHTTISTVLS